MIRSGNTEKHDIEVGTVTAGDAVFNVHILRPATDDASLPFLVAKVEYGGKLVWDYQTCGSSDYGRLAWADDELVVAFIERGRHGKLSGVTALLDVLANKQTPVNRTVALKHAAAKFLGREPKMTAVEQRVLDIIVARRREEMRAEEERVKAERAARKEERRQKMLARTKVTGYTASGESRYGIPVAGDEWHSLDSGTSVVLVEFYNDGVAGPLIESFVVNKGTNGRPKKFSPVQVTASNVAAAPRAVKPVGTALIEHGADFIEVQLYSSMEDIRQARMQGLNGGTYVAVKSDAAQIEVYSVTKDAIMTQGHFGVLF